MNYLKNAWYAAAWNHEVSTGTLARTLLDEFVVFYRDETGKPVALADRCPHRFAPLSRGKVSGGIIECPYHGLRFNAAGACVSIRMAPSPKLQRCGLFPCSNAMA